MADIMLDGSYFISNSLSNSNYTIVQVKLTDSAIKVLEDYQSLKNIERNISIQFDNDSNNGVIQIPNRKSHENPKGLCPFNVSVSSIQQDPKAETVFQSIQQSSQQKIHVLGPINTRLMIQAADDSYKLTKSKINKVHEEEKKNYIKKLDKITGKNISVKKIKSRKTPITKLKSLSRAAPTPKPIESRTAQQGYSYKERLIHMLALRSMSLLDIIENLKKGGIPKADEDALTAIVTLQLKDICSFSNQSKVYTLLRHILMDDIRFDWPFYSDEERQKVLQLLTTVSKQMPTKRGTGDTMNNTVKSKKSKPNLNRPVKKNTTGSITKSNIDLLSSLISDSIKSAEPQMSNSNPKPAVKAFKPAQSQHNGNKQETKIEVPVAVPVSVPEQPLVESKFPKVTNNYNHRPATPSNMSDCQSLISKLSDNTLEGSTGSGVSDPDFTTQFSAITRDEQRHEYKKLFNDSYDEYLTLHKSINKVHQKFADLHDVISKHSKDDPEYEKLRDQTYDEYKKAKADPIYMAERKRHDFIHKKLSFLKDLVSKYDNKLLANWKP